jgi:hypothetical protein
MVNRLWDNSGRYERRRTFWFERKIKSVKGTETYVIGGKSSPLLLRKMKVT